MGLASARAAIRRFLKCSGSGAAATKDTRVPVKEKIKAGMEAWDEGLAAGEKVAQNVYRTGKLVTGAVASVATAKVAFTDLIEPKMKEGAPVTGVFYDFKTRAKDLLFKDKEICKKADREDPAPATKQTLLLLAEQQRVLQETLLKLQGQAEEPQKDVTTQKKGPE